MKRREFIKNSAAVLTGTTIVGVGIDRWTVTAPGLPQAPFEHSRTGRPLPGDIPFTRHAIAPTYTERRQMYLDWVSLRATSHDTKGVLIDLIKLEAGTIKTVSDGALQEALKLGSLGDFTIAYLVRLYFLHHDDGSLTAKQASDIRRVLLGFKYGLDEPGKFDDEIWTENHQILTHGSDYLVGQMFPEERFTNDGRSGREHEQKARAQVLRWLNFHARTGPAEWDSVPYYNMDVAALLNLVEFAQDTEVQARATMMVDLLLFDCAVNSFYGQMGTSHGRAYAQNVLTASGDSLLTVQTLVFGFGRLQTVDMASTMLVTGKRYQLPPVLEAIGRNLPGEMLNFERHSIPLSSAAAAQYGLSLHDLRDFEIWWGMGAFTNPEVINLTFDAIETYDLWHYPAFRPLKRLARFLRPIGLLPLASRMMNPDSNGTVMSEVNKVTYRTPDAMLSTAQDYRPGQKGYQQHIWQATLSPYAVVFVTHPGSPEQNGNPGYWSSNGRLPRNAQYRNILISIYNLPRHFVQTEFEARPYGYTHAYFPRWAFDEIAEFSSPAGGGWIFGRAGQGYVALYSHLPYQWTASGPEACQEVGAPGFENIWICQVGRKTFDGTFEAFVDRVSHAGINIDRLEVTYLCPGSGEIKFGWSGPLTVDGKVSELHDYPRWRNPYSDIEFGSERFHIECDGKSLDLDFQSGSRSVG